MFTGDLLLKFAFLLALAATGIYATTFRGRERSSAGNIVFALHSMSLLAALGLLAGYFLNHRFEFEYVAHNSSRALSPALTLAALWAGQEGSILLWATLGSLVGVFLFLQPGRLSAPAMTFVGLSQLFMMALLMAKSPFVTTPVVPADGAGLNPLLEDPWMVAHPPVLFVGYAAMLVPFALGAAALVRGEYDEWNKRVWPWSLFAVVSLGTGIVLGGIWAYKVLGWGGYWGWDPVENASLVPWLLAVAMLHGLLIQRTLGAMTRTNLLLATLGWLTVVGGTYLTRSGVLSDFSVHSFADTGLGPTLTTFLLGFTFIGGALLAFRWVAIEPKKVEWVSASRESALWLGLMTVVALAVLVAAGTTMPLLTGLAGKPASVRPEFYHGVTMPLALAILLLMAVAPALRWTSRQGLSWTSFLPAALVAGVALLATSFFAGLRDPLWLALLFATGLMLGVNVWMAAKLFRRGWTYGAGYLGHAGVAIMAVGIAVSTGFGRTERLQLDAGEVKDVLGYRVTYAGAKMLPRDTRALEIKVEKGKWSMTALPKMMPSPRGDGMMHTPALDLVRDLYVSPVDVGTTEAQGHAEPVWLTKNQSTDVGGARYTFRGFRMDHEAQQFMAYADIDVERDGERFTVSPAVTADEHGSHAIPADFPGGGKLMLSRMDADNARIAVLLPSVGAAIPTAIIDFSVKPLVNLVWVGALLTLLGTALAGVRRAQEQTTAVRRRVEAPAEVPAQAATHTA